MVGTNGSRLEVLIKGKEVFIGCPVCGDLTLLKRAKAGKGRLFIFCLKCRTQLMTHSDVGEAAFRRAIKNKKATKKE